MIDGLNLLYQTDFHKSLKQRSGAQNFKMFFDIVLKLLERDYAPVLVIHRRNLSELSSKLRGIGVYSFQCDVR